MEFVQHYETLYRQQICCCSNMRLIVFSLSSTVKVLLVCVLNTRCIYLPVFKSLLKLLNPSKRITIFISSDCIMKTSEGTFSSTEAKIWSICFDNWLSCRFYQASSLNHSFLISSLLLNALVPMFAGWLIPTTCFYCAISFEPRISATRLATNTCCLRWKLCFHCITVVDSDQKLQQCMFISRSSTICSCLCHGCCLKF